MATKITTPIPQNPIGENFVWREWFQKLSDRVFGNMASQDSANVSITGGSISGISLSGNNIANAHITDSYVDNTPIGLGTPSTAHFTYTNTATLAVDNALDGQVLIGRTSDHQVVPNTLTAGTGISITNGPGSVTIKSTTGGSYIEAYDLSASIPLTATPILLAPASTGSSSGITYNSSTGVFTFTNAGTYSLSLNINAISSAANQFVYIWAENWNGSAWVANTNSGKYLQLINNQVTQIISAQSVYRTAGQQVRYWIYSNSNKVILQTLTLPGISATVYTPAIRIQYA